MNIAELLSKQAKLRSGAAAIIDARGSMSFGQLEDLAARGATQLERSGLQPGDAVLFFRPMSRQMYVELMAAFRLGLVPMALDPSAGREHIERCCELRQPKALIASAKAHLLRLVSPALRAIPRKFVGLNARAFPPRFAIEPRKISDPALLTFTSGSTGKPKAAVRTHGFLLEQHKVLQRCLLLTPGQVDLTTLPIFALANLGSGVTSVIPDADLRRPGEIVPDPVVRQIDAHNVETTAASPAFLGRLAGCGRSLTSLRRVFVGGGPVFPPLLDRLKHMAPRSDIIAVYGSTEAEPIAEISRERIGPEDLEAMCAGGGLLAGCPVEEINLRILPDRWGTPLTPYSKVDFEADCLGPHQIGEIVVSGGHVLPGYLDGQGDHETKFKVEGESWHRTGDCGYFDDRGRLWLAGRAAAKVVDNRGAIYPFSVECAASGRPEIARIALIGYQGRRLLAVEWAPGSKPGAADLIESLRWASIDEVLPVRRIPVDRRHNSKIDYPALLRLVAKAHSDKEFT